MNEMAPEQPVQHEWVSDTYYHQTHNWVLPDQRLRSCRGME